MDGLFSFCFFFSLLSLALDWDMRRWSVLGSIMALILARSFEQTSQRAWFSLECFQIDQIFMPFCFGFSMSLVICPFKMSTAGAS
jgi:hypothetical protein